MAYNIAGGFNMNGQAVPLNLLPLGKPGVVRDLLSDASSRRRLLDLGLITGTPVEAVLRSPAGDPTAFQFRGALLALRNAEACQILVDLL